MKLSTSEGTRYHYNENFSLLVLEIRMMSGTSKQKMWYPVHIILSKLDNDIKEHTWSPGSGVVLDCINS